MRAILLLIVASLGACGGQPSHDQRSQVSSLAHQIAGEWVAAADAPLIDLPEWPAWPNTLGIAIKTDGDWSLADLTAEISINGTTSLFHVVDVRIVFASLPLGVARSAVGRGSWYLEEASSADRVLPAGFRLILFDREDSKGPILRVGFEHIDSAEGDAYGATITMAYIRPRRG